MKHKLSLKENIEGMIMSLIVLFVMIMTIIAVGTSVLAGNEDPKKTSGDEKKK